MDNSTIKKILDFLEEKENKKHKDRDNLVWKLRFGYPLTKEELNHKGDLHLSFSNLEFLPKGLKVGGFLYLFMCIHLTSLPEGLEVGGNLYLDNCKKLKSLPEGLKVGSFLNLRNCINLKSLPKGLEVGGDLQIENTPLTKYSDEQLREMIEPGFIKGSIIRTTGR